MGMGAVELQGERRRSPRRIVGAPVAEASKEESGVVGGRAIYAAAYDLGDKVLIDGDDAIAAFVTAICFRSHIALFECEWMSSGSTRCGWFNDWRLAPAEGARRTVGFR